MTMRSRSTLVLAACLSLVAVAPAVSQSLEIGRDGLRVLPDDRRGPSDIYNPPPRRGPPPRISEREAARIARYEGMREIDDVYRQRRTIRVDGADRRGRDMSVIIDSRTGEVVDVR